MQEIEFTKEDEYCIKNFGYNTLGDYEDLKQLEDKEHLIVEELEYRLQQKENIIKEVREIFKYYGNKEDIVGYAYYSITGESLLELLEILDSNDTKM